MQRAGEPRRPLGSGHGNFTSTELDGPGRGGRGRHAREAGLKEAVAGIQVWAAGCGCGRNDGGGKGHTQV